MNLDWQYEKELSDLRQVIVKLEEENVMLKFAAESWRKKAVEWSREKAIFREAVHKFCEGSSWACQSGKDQPHIKPLFDLTSAPK